MKRKLIIHVGMGKTGSTSIQMALGSNENLLAENGVKYLGLMLENTPLPKSYTWNHSGGWHTFLRLDLKEACQELVEAFTHINENLPQNLSTLIWSNESLFFDFDHVDALKSIESIYDIHVVGYIRRPDDWIASAYLQWGIKHKTYTGPLQSFRQWVKTLPYSVAPRIDIWKESVDSSKFFNFNAIEDITRHFLERSAPALAQELRASSSNHTPPPQAMALFCAYNSTLERQVLPSELEPLLSRSGLMNKLPPARNYNSLLPTTKDLQAYIEENAEEIREVNKRLDMQGEPGFRLAAEEIKDRSVSQQDINRALLRTIVHLADEVESLKAKMGKEYRSSD